MRLQDPSAALGWLRKDWVCNETLGSDLCRAGPSEKRLLARYIPYNMDYCRSHLPSYGLHKRHIHRLDLSKRKSRQTLAKLV